jgi:toxin ParE1/3/4
VKSRAVEILKEALDEAAEAVNHYAEIDQDLAVGFAEEFTIALRRAGEVSSALASYLHGTKRYPFRRFPYQLIFREFMDRIQIIAVAHQRRRPGYWKRRLRKK